MNKDTFKGEWNQLKGKIKQEWADLTDDDLTHAEGSFGELFDEWGKYSVTACDRFTCLNAF